MRTISRVDGLTILSTLVFFALVVSGMARGVFVREGKAVRALEIQGFSEIKITSKVWFFVGLRGGDKSDCVRFTATAKNPAGATVQVYVFSGWPFKGATIRTP